MFVFVSCETDMILKVFVSFAFILQILSAQKIFTITAHNAENQNIHQFWRSTGFCPPKENVETFLLSDNVKINLALIGALPNKAIEYVRIHWLLELVSIKPGKDHPIYDFKKLDILLDWLFNGKLVPIFEIMGNPSNYFKFQIDSFQIGDWVVLLEDIISRYKDRYGVDYVQKWKFESWNEPDLKGYNTVNFTLDSYLNYYLASQLALWTVSYNLGLKDPLKMGGPAGLFKNMSNHPLCWGILKHCNMYYETEIINLKFLSWHKKGEGLFENIANNSLKLLNEINEKYPNLKNLPVANTEADIMVGWSKSFEWRADVRYATLVASTIIDHLKKFKNFKIEILSTDNGFLNYHPYYFTQRTLFARFQMNNTNPPHIQFIKKPIYSIMALLTFLTGKISNIEISNKNYKDISIGTELEDEKNYENCFIKIFHNDTYFLNPSYTLGFRYELVIDKKYSGTAKYVAYLITSNLTNPYKIWKISKSPVFPEEKIREDMRKVEGPYRLVPPTTLGKNPIYVDINVTSTTFLMVHVCNKSVNGPGPVINLRIFNVTRGEALLVWSDEKVGTRCIKTYEVEFLAYQSLRNFEVQEFSRVNKDDLIFLSYQHVALGLGSGPAQRLEGRDTARGQYRVRAVDYWDRPGPYSQILTYPYEH